MRAASVPTTCGPAVERQRPGEPARNQTAIKSNKDFQAAYTKARGNNTTFGFRPSGNHSWPYRGAQLTALKPDLIATLNR
jgi:S-formylglutathione hydrolase FrmB